jgi:hypothetical protein
MKCCLDFLGGLGIRIGCPFSRIARQMLPRTLDGLNGLSSPIRKKMLGT